jgi:hypothetical protein
MFYCLPQAGQSELDASLLFDFKITSRNNVPRKKVVNKKMMVSNPVTLPVPAANRPKSFISPSH